jgi:hypothetical protein
MVKHSKALPENSAIAKPSIRELNGYKKAFLLFRKKLILFYKSKERFLILGTIHI